jgi:pSer/pThr/pTyr-binding forkhead associated (FHA) protein
MEWNLVIGKGEHKGKIIPIRSNPFVIGRDDDCQLRPASHYVSHRHCMLIRRGSSLTLRDCHSTNGTFVNDRRVGEVELRPGDRLGIGPLAFVVSITGPVPTNGVHKKSGFPPKPRIVSEEAIAALLLEMDKGQVAGAEPDAGRTRRMTSISASEGDAAKVPGTASPNAVSEQTPLSPAEVAAAILKKKSFEWLRHYKRTREESKIPSG